MSMPELPQELIDEIIHRVAEADDYRRKTVAACALTCRAWLRQSRVHLFSETLIFHPDGNRTSFEDSPIAADYAFDVVLKKQLIDLSGCLRLRKLTLLLIDFTLAMNDIPSCISLKVTELSVLGCMFSQPSALTRAICAFPNVVDLIMKFNTFASESNTADRVTYITPPLSGSLEVTGRNEDPHVIALAAIPGRYRFIKLSLADNGAAGNKILKTSGAQAESLTISVMGGEQRERQRTYCSGIANENQLTSTYRQQRTSGHSPWKSQDMSFCTILFYQSLPRYYRLSDS